MSSIKNIKKIGTCIFLLSIMGTQLSLAQETETNVKTNSPFHNQLFFNRYLINPTFSLVRENKSYLNILHRNQYASFEDNYQNYYLGFSNRLNDHTALGIGIYGQWAGVMQEFGFNANYATSVQLGTNSKLTFGTNFTYLSEGINRNSIVATENDPLLQETKKENKITVQPGIALTLGKFDFGIYATDLINYNQTTNNLITNFNENTLKASVQYTHTLMTSRGLFANARILPLVQLGKKEEGSLSYVGSVLLDLPEHGWFQTTYDDTYGLSLGLGFNLNKKLSLGYLMEKDLSPEGANLGWNHEISMAYTFKDELPDSADNDQLSNDKRVDEIVKNYEEQILQLKADKLNTVVSENSLAYRNSLLVDELILRQDSVEAARDKMFEQRFEMLVRLLRNEIKNETTPAPTKSMSAPVRTAVAVQEYKKPPTKVKQVSVPAKTAVAVTRVQEPSKTTTKKREEFNDLRIRIQNRSDIMGVESGYYLIANVYKNKRYLSAFMKTLNEQGLNARKFYNKENGLYYVYLADFKGKQAAKSAVVNNLDGKYQEDKWIMQIQQNTATAQVVFDD